jgi:hypothetical protein
VLAAVELAVARLPAGPGLVEAAPLSGGRLAAEAVGQEHLPEWGLIKDRRKDFLMT